jgi:pullulanase/glycogen debranching enzyme
MRETDGSHGPYEPAKGHRFNPNKVLLDPYAKSIGRPLFWEDTVFGYKIGDPAADLSFDDRDSASFAPLGQVIDTAFTWGDDRPPRTPWHKTLIYELHVRVSPSSTRVSPRATAAPLLDWVRRRSFAICLTWASPPLSFFRSIIF